MAYPTLPNCLDSKRRNIWLCFRYWKPCLLRFAEQSQELKVRANPGLKETCLPSSTSLLPPPASRQTGLQMCQVWESLGVYSRVRLSGPLSSTSWVYT